MPQRQDFDTFFGSRVEADFISAVQDRTKTAFEKWIAPKLNRRYPWDQTLAGTDPRGSEYLTTWA